MRFKSFILSEGFLTTKRLLVIMAAVMTVLLLLNGCTQSNNTDQNKEHDSLVNIIKRDMVPITGGTYEQTDGIDSFNHTVSNFQLGRYEVTYELWYTVYQWAIVNGYTFANKGKEGHDGIAGAAPTSAKYEPVTTINWRDAIVWCNAYSEMSGLKPCYTYASKVIKDSSNENATVCDGAVCNWSEKGYRLPSEGEWQYAASNKGSTPYNYASGATADTNNAIATQKVAWYKGNSEGSTKTVGTTPNSNALTLYDMSGNVWEWCWDWDGKYPGVATDYRGPASSECRCIRGSSWSNDSNYLQVGERGRNNSNAAFGSLGFRVARTN